MKQAALSHAGNQNVREGIVVVIADSDAHAIHFDIQPNALRNVSERAVAIIAIQPWSGPLAFVSRPVHGIDQQNVLPTVIVVVEESATGSECFGQQLAAICAAVVLKMDAS